MDGMVRRRIPSVHVGVMQLTKIGTKHTWNVNVNRGWNNLLLIAAPAVNPVSGAGYILIPFSTDRILMDGDVTKLDAPEAPSVDVSIINAQPEFGGTLHRHEPFLLRLTLCRAGEEQLRCGPPLPSVKLDTDLRI
jgi:hypothetical protein